MIEERIACQLTYSVINELTIFVTCTGEQTEDLRKYNS
jgi:hypothetical protein